MTEFYQINKEKTTDIWLTPEFDLDPCCPNNLAWKTANKFYSLENGQNGLELSWEGRVFLNPPYSNWVPFLSKLKEHNDGIALIFARTETKGFFDHVWNDAHSILFIKRRVKFIKADQTTTGSSTAPSVLIAYGEYNTEKIRQSDIEGKLILLNN